MFRNPFPQELVERGERSTTPNSRQSDDGFCSDRMHLCQLMYSRFLIKQMTMMHVKNVKTVLNVVAASPRTHLFVAFLVLLASII